MHVLSRKMKFLCGDFLPAHFKRPPVQGLATESEGRGKDDISPRQVLLVKLLARQLQGTQTMKQLLVGVLSLLFVSTGQLEAASTTTTNNGDPAASITTELLEHPKLQTLSRGDPANPSVFIAIGSAPKKHVLRDTVRRTWLTSCQPPSCGYRFFTDGNVTLGDTQRTNGNGVLDDIVTTPAEEGGYANFGIRAVQQMEWSLRNVDFDHYLRIDDDGMLCVDHLMHDLQQLPLTRLFWGKYWCQHMVRFLSIETVKLTFSVCVCVHAVSS